MTEPTTEAGRRAQAALTDLLDGYRADALVAKRFFHGLDAIDIAAIDTLGSYARHKPGCDVLSKTDSGDCQCGFGVALFDIDRLLKRASPDTLGAAWSEAEAAMPEGWWLEGVMVVDISESADLSVEQLAWSAEASGHRGARSINELGSTPAEALRALAAKLREMK